MARTFCGSIKEIYVSGAILNYINFILRQSSRFSTLFGISSLIVFGYQLRSRRLLLGKAELKASKRRTVFYHFESVLVVSPCLDFPLHIGYGYELSQDLSSYLVERFLNFNTEISSKTYKALVFGAKRIRKNF